MEDEISGWQFHDIFDVVNPPLCDSIPGTNFFEMLRNFQVTAVPEQSQPEKFKPGGECSALAEGWEFPAGEDDVFKEEDQQKSKSALQFSTANPCFSVGGASGKSEEVTVEKSKNAARKKMVRKQERLVTRYAFKTNSECNTFEDGYKWQKYGKKMVKNSPTPRNYYRCSNKECIVKKRVECDAKDPSILITTYEGTHNHEGHSIIYYIGKKMIMPLHGLSNHDLSSQCDECNMIWPFEG